MIFGLGGGGYGIQESDPNLGDKLAALKRKRGNPDDKVTDFLQREIGVDRKDLPFTPVQACEYLASLFGQGDDFSQIRFVGNSLGLVSVDRIYPADDPASIGPNDPQFDEHDLRRAYDTLVKEHAGQRAYSFRISHDHYLGDQVEVDVEPGKPVHEADPVKYPPGSVLRIQRQRVEGDQLVLDHEYIRIGGLLDETTPTILETMRPIHELTGWIVTEEL